MCVCVCVCSPDPHRSRQRGGREVEAMRVGILDSSAADLGAGYKGHGPSL